MKITPHRHRPSIALLAILGALVCLGLTACGGGSPSGSPGASTTTTASSSSGTAGSFAANPSRSRRFGALRECLQRNGVTLPTRPAGAGAGAPGGAGTAPAPAPGGPTVTGGGGHGFDAGGRGAFLQGLSSSERAKFEAAAKKCRASEPFRAGSFAHRGPGFTNRNPAAVAAFATCMRRNGVNLPKPNTSGHGPVFKAAGIDRTSSTFKNAERKCLGQLGVPAGGPTGPHGPPGVPPPAGA